MSAMAELILEKGFEATNISEITARADVGRSTFYAHFADKEDLLQGSIQEGMRRDLEAAIETDRSHPESSIHPALAFCLPMLEHADENRDLFQAMFGKPSGNLMTDLAHDVWADLVRENWPGADELAVRSVVGAFGAAISWWLLSAPELTPNEVDERFRAIMSPLFEK